ncbi:MAG: membrane protein insertion efficiency factor YidD [Clostridia bacterium]|nr:membrane protein insertion efficiency factor YidD [Clostridia bacterium]
MLSVKLISLYQKYLSKGTCLYEPTCSHYMLESIHNNGFFVGALLGLGRLLRCNPLSKGGYDPPKENFILYIWLI